MNTIFWAIISLLLIAGCTIRQESSYQFNEITDVHPQDVSRIEMRSGSSGELRTIVDREAIEDFFTLVESLDYIRQTPTRQFTGYSYYADFYSGQQNLLRLTFAGDRVEFDNTTFYIDQQIRDSLDELFTQGLPYD